MQQIRTAILLCFTLLIVGCSNNSDTTEQDKQDSIHNSNSAISYIDEDNYVDERSAIVEAMEYQKEQLKFGFLTDDYILYSQEINYTTPDEDSEDDVELEFDQFYEFPKETVLYNATMNLEDHIAESLLLTDGKEITSDKIDGSYDMIDDSLTFRGVKDAFLYDLNFGSESADANGIMQLVADTMKTEAEGAYDPFYKLFNLDIDNLKYPKINAEAADVFQTFMTLDRDFDDNYYASVATRYGTNIPLHAFTYKISELGAEKESETTDDTLKEEKTDGGISLTTFYYDDMFKYYEWEDDTYQYEIEVELVDEDESMTDEDIYEIVDSAMEDDRHFDNKEVFEPINTTPSLSDKEEEINELFQARESE